HYLVVEAEACEAAAPIKLTSLHGTMVHEGDEKKIEEGRIEDQNEIVRIPPAVKGVRSDQEPWDPEAGPTQRKEHRQHNRHEDEKCPRVEQHGRSGLSGAGNAICSDLAWEQIMIFS